VITLILHAVDDTHAMRRFVSWALSGRAPTDHGVAPVQDHALAGRDPLMGAATTTTPSGDHVARTGLPCALTWTSKASPAPGGLSTHTGSTTATSLTSNSASGPDGHRHGGLGDIDLDDEAPIPRRPQLAQPSPLADRNQLHGRDLTNLLTRAVDDPPWAHRDPLPEELLRPPTREMKHTSWLSGLAAVRKTERRTPDLAHLGFVSSPTGSTTRASWAG
jgi:hypothetical protein